MPYAAVAARVALAAFRRSAARHAGAARRPATSSWAYLVTPCLSRPFLILVRWPTMAIAALNHTDLNVRRDFAVHGGDQRRSVPRALLRELLLLAADVVDRAEDRPAGPEGAGGAEAVGVRVLLGLLRGVLGGAHDRVARGVLVVEAVERAALVLGLVEDHADAPEGVVHFLVARGRRRAR